MEKIVKITTLENDSSDYSYWSQKSPIERLEAIEFLRGQFMNFASNAEQRLQRVCTITFRK
jgi:hypothetical protein